MDTEGMSIWELRNPVPVARGQKEWAILIMKRQPKSLHMLRLYAEVFQLFQR